MRKERARGAVVRISPRSRGSRDRVLHARQQLRGLGGSPSMAAVAAGRLAGRLGNAAYGARVPILPRLGQAVAEESGEGSRLGRRAGEGTARRRGHPRHMTGSSSRRTAMIVASWRRPMRLRREAQLPVVVPPHVDQAALRRRSLRTRSVMPTLMRTLMRTGAQAGGAPAASPPHRRHVDEHALACWAAVGTTPPPSPDGCHRCPILGALDHALRLVRQRLFGHRPTPFDACPSVTGAFSHSPGSRCAPAPDQACGPTVTSPSVRVASASMIAPTSATSSSSSRR